MASVDIRLLGEFEVRVDGRPVAGFESATAEALLARLAVDPGRRVRRAELAELLWPDRAEGKALANLRHSLAVLRRTLGDDERERPAIVSDRDVVAIDAGAEVRIDVVEFRRLAATPPSEPRAVAAWESALALRHGRFLDGPALAASAGWEAWVRELRTGLDELTLAALHRLAELRERTGERPLALAHARAAIAIDPWDERAHTVTVRLLATGGEQAAALLHAEAFAADLVEHLGAHPSAAFEALVAQVRAGELAAPTPHVPGPGSEQSVVPTTQRVVGRDDELAWLHRSLDDALAGGGGEVFLRGEAGSGKTMLMRAFGAEAAVRMPALCVLVGAGNAYTGPGDPFLPIRQILGLLCGDLDPGWRHGCLTPAGASRLWEALPDVVAAVLEDGPYLLGTLIDGPALESRFREAFPAHPLGARLSDAVAEAVRRIDDPMRRQQPVLEQVGRVLARLATRRPVLLLIDDLQWADTGTVDLIRHLALQVPAAPMLIVAAYRPSDRDPDGGDPVEILVNEVQAASSANRVLEVVGTRKFVDEWLDSEPNVLDEEFRQRLYGATHGHALFTVETVAAMRQRGDLVLDERGRWISAAVVAWDTLAPRVEASIAARAMLLPPEVRRDLEIASVQGDRFSARVVAGVRGGPLADVVLRLSRLTASSQALIEPAGRERIGSRALDNYRFRHTLIRQYFIDHLAPPDRSAIHEATGRALERLHADRPDDVAVELAEHFDEAGVIDAAVEHRSRAGRRAQRLSATVEAIGHLRRALELSESLTPGSDRDRRELGLLTSLGVCLQANAGYDGEETLEIYERIRRLIPTIGPCPETAQALGSLTTIDGLRGRYADAIAGAQHLKDVAVQLDLPPIEAVADTQTGWLLLMTGRLTEAYDRLDGVVARYDEEWDEWLTYAVGIHVRSTAVAWRALAAWHLGRLDEAQRDAAAAVDDARRVGYPFGLVFALAVAGCGVCAWLGDGACVVAMAEEERSLADREDFAFYRTASEVHHGLGLAMVGRADEGLQEAEQGLARWSVSETGAFLPWLRFMYAEQLIAAGRLDAASAAVADVQRLLAEGEEQVVATYLPTARAALARACGDDATAEAILVSGIEVQEVMGARGPQLRAVTDLAALLCDQGRHREAAHALAPVLAHFQDVAGSADLRRARDVMRRTAC